MLLLIKKLHILIILLFLGYQSIAQKSNSEPSSYSVSLKKGEGVYSLLNRYNLNNACNVRAFYEINHIKENQAIHIGKKYKLPVKIYRYNGRSIRSTIKLNDWDRAVAIKKFNEDILTKGIRKTHYADSKILWVPYHLIDCEIEKPVTDKEGTTKREEKISTSKKRNTLFGKDYQNFEVVDQSLKDQVFYIVSGHGGPDPGAMCTDHASDLCEDEYAYDVCLRLARNLMQHGAQVEVIIQDKNDGIRDEKFLACDKDETCGSNNKIPLNQRKRLQQRASYINKLYKRYKRKGYKTHKTIVIHVDANRSSKRQDVFFYHHKASKEGRRMAESIHRTFESKYAKYQKGRGYSGFVSPRGLYMTNYVKTPVVYVELGNIKNHKDQKRLLLNTNRQALANWFFEGIIGN